MDIPVLKYVDVLIGLSLVMVLVSTIVLAVTQVLLNVTFARARHLQRGLARLIAGLDPAAMRGHADYVAQLIVRHPLIGRQTFLTPVRKFLLAVNEGSDDGEALLPTSSPGAVVQREELAFLLIEFAAAEGPLMDPAERGRAPAPALRAQEALAAALRHSGVEDPAATLRAIRVKAVENERANPTQSAQMWRSNAVVDCATSDFIGKLHDGFDNTMARATDGFAVESQLWVAGVALAVAFALQLDSFALMKRLSTDDKARAAYIEVAERLEADRDKGSTANGDAATVDDQIKAARESYAMLGSPAISLLPARAQFPPPRKHLPGILLSWVFLSLGAPFWFDMLKNLLKLRSVLAQKDEKERAKRESVQSPPSGVAAAPPPAAAVVEVVGEEGDLAATGAVG